MIYLVVPCYNEQEVLADTNRKLLALLAEIPVETRILYVDDGSTDNTWNIIQTLRQEKQETVCGIQLAHNVGHQSALWAGMETSIDQAEAIITIDADLQDDIRVIPRMVQDYLGGTDVVYGVRRERKMDTVFKRFTAQAFYRLITLMGCDTVYNHADFRLLSHRAAKALLCYQERNLYLRGLVPLLGFRTKQEYYDRHPRLMGTTKYPVRKMLALAFEGITSFSTRPVRWILLAGLVFILVSVGVISWAIYARITGRTVEGWTSLLVSLWFLSGVLLVAIGIVGEYIGKIYMETKRRPRYTIMETVLCFLLLLTVPIRTRSAEYLSMSEAIRMAQANSYEAMVARLSLMSQYWSYRSFRAELLPAVNMSGGLLQYNRSMVEARNFDDGRISYVENNSMSNSLSLSIDQNIAPLGGKLSLQSYLYRLDQFSYDTRIYNSQPLRLTYTQPLRAYNSLKWQKRTEPLKYERAKRAYLESMEGVTITVVGMFFNVLSAQSAHKQSVSNLKDRQRLFDIAQKRFGLGTITKSEMLQLELSLLNAQVEVSNNKLTLDNQRFSLFSYLRLSDYKGIELLPPYAIPDIVIDTDRVVEKALANSTHTLSQRVTLLEAQKVVAQAKANKGIQVQLNGEVALNRTADAFRDAYRGLRDNEIVGLAVSLPVFDWGVSKGRVRMAQADLEVTRTQLEQAHETYLQDLRTNVLQFNTQSAQCKNTLRAQEIADERYEITKRRFEAGAVTVTELNTAQQESESARAQYLRLLQTYWTDYYTLRKATLYDWIHGHDIDVDVEDIIRK